MFKMFQTFINWMTGRDRTEEFEIIFGHDTAALGEHGMVIGTWLKEGKRNPICISFFFKGHIHAPKLTVSVLTELFRHARMAGIEPTHLHAYDLMMKGRSPSNR
jgi:hypothetical protein